MNILSKFFSKKPDEDRIRETKLIRKHFSFLFEQGFSIIHAEPAQHFNNWLLDLKSTSVSVQFAEDRSELLIRIGPSQAGTGWSGTDLWDLQVLVFHLTKDTDSIPQHFFTREIEEAARIFHSHTTQIFDIFRNTNYETLTSELRKSQGALMRKWEPEIFRGGWIG